MLLKPASPIYLRGRSLPARAGAWLFGEGAGGTIANLVEPSQPVDVIVGDNAPAPWSWQAGASGWQARIHGEATGNNTGTCFGLTGIEGDPLDIRGNITIHATVLSMRADNGQYLVARSGTNSIFQYGMSLNTNSLQFRRGATTYTVPFARQVGIRYHIAVVLDGDQLRFYADGVHVGQQTVTEGALLSPHFRIGGRSNSVNGTFNAVYLEGAIDNVQIFATALSDAEISQLHHDPYADFRWSRSPLAVADWLIERPRADLDDPPVIAGSSVVNQILSVTYPGGWVTGSPITGYQYRWQRTNDNGETWEDIPDADAIDYMVRVADVGWRIRAGVLAGNDGGYDETQWAWSAWSEPVPPPGPAFTYLTISATPSLMSTISATPSLIGVVSRGP